MSKVRFTTNLGEFTVELNAEKAPITVENFLAYVQSGHYDGTIFHRVIKKFMIQGGGHTVGMKEKSRTLRASIKNEADNGLTNDKYTLAMARTSDPHSATAQFFINATDNDFLNFTAPTDRGWGYAVFGAVTEGFEVIDVIEAVKTGRSGFHNDVPVEDVIIEKAQLV
jgi:peptidyl-prolyl cis-trans isomerase B (cyclophilin B)